MLYNIILRMIERGNTGDLAEKIDVLYVGNRLTKEEYTRLAEMLNNN